jgi:polysaccharide export outer membrane protein
MRRPKLKVTLILMLFLGTCFSQGFATENDYEIGPGDVLEIKVYDHPDLDTVSRVDNDGHILFPLAGQIKVGSLTTASASKAIADKLDGEYIINPQVSIFVQEFRSKKVMVIGEVVRPGLYELSGPTTLLELISKAGGLTRTAGQSATIRRTPRDGQKQGEEITVSVKDLLESGLELADVPLVDGDTVNVPKAGSVYVTGQVNRPAAYPLEPGTSVIKAITMAGGFSPLAAQGKVKIIRKVDGKEQTLEKVSLHDLLRAEDVLVVPESFF